eukprot:1159402-Pelagomonas_calceolata.AAC.8
MARKMPSQEHPPDLHMQGQQSKQQQWKQQERKRTFAVAAVGGAAGSPISHKKRTNEYGRGIAWRGHANICMPAQSELLNVSCPLSQGYAQAYLTPLLLDCLAAVRSFLQLIGWPPFVLLTKHAWLQTLRWLTKQAACSESENTLHNHRGPGAAMDVTEAPVPAFRVPRFAAC